jgi:hypothetical protein
VVRIERGVQVGVARVTHPHLSPTESVIASNSDLLIRRIETEEAEPRPPDDAILPQKAQNRGDIVRRGEGNEKEKREGRLTDAKTRALKKPCMFTRPCVSDSDQDGISRLRGE